MRKVTQTDSLDLLLDPMCNTFAGIVFIAMLLGVVAQNAPVLPIAQQQLQRRRVKLEEGRILAEINEMQIELAGLDTLTRTTREVVDRLRGSPEFPLLDDVKDATAQQARLEQRAAALRDQLAREKAEVAAAVQSADSVQERIEKLKEEIASLEGRLKKAENPADREFRLPRSQRTHKQPVWTMIKNGRLYLVSDLDSLGDNVWDTSFVSTRQEDNCLIFTPRSGAGLSLRDEARCAAVVKRFATDRIRRGYFVDFSVYEDSWEQFIAFKEQLTRAGLDYAWKPLSMSERYEIFVVNAPIVYETQ